MIISVILSLFLSIICPSFMVRLLEVVHKVIFLSFSFLYSSLYFLVVLIKCVNVMFQINGSYHLYFLTHF